MTNKEFLTKALSFYEIFNIDFIDAYLAAFAEDENIRQIYSDDKDFDKIQNLKRLES